MGSNGEAKKDIRFSPKPDDIRPFPGKAIVQLLPPEETTAGGIILPDRTQTPQKIGLVISVGEGAKVKPGDGVFVEEGADYVNLDQAVWGNIRICSCGGSPNDDITAAFELPREVVLLLEERRGIVK